MKAEKIGKPLEKDWISYPKLKNVWERLVGVYNMIHEHCPKNFKVVW